MSTDINTLDKISQVIGERIQIVNERDLNNSLSLEWEDLLINHTSYGNFKLAVSNDSGAIIQLYINTPHIKQKTDGRNVNILDYIVKLAHLKILYLWDSLIEYIPNEITELENLEVFIVMGKNSLNNLPKEIVKLRKLRELKVNPETIQNIPPEIVAQGINAVRNFFDSIEQTPEKNYLNEAKLVFIGKGFVGKTTIIRKLINRGYKLDPNVRNTEGIDINIWDLPVQIKKDNTFRFNVWDFGGQEKYNSTHQFFITEKTLYIFVTEERQGNSFADFDYWLNVIQILGNDSPVIVVQNKIDLHRMNIPKVKYQKQFPNIFAFVDVSCANGYEHTIDNLIEQIKSALQNQKLPQVGDELPSEWVDIRRELEKKRADYISYDEYVRVCKKHGLSTEKADHLSQYYHDLGVIFHYSKDPLLSQMVILNPNWVLEGAYSVLDSRHIEKNMGKFGNSDLNLIWGESKYKNKHPELLALLMNYNLCFELGSDGIYIVPELLSHDPVDYKLDKETGLFVVVYHYKFLPAGILTRLIVKLHKLIEKDKFWKHGVVIKYKDARALITEDEDSKSITIEIDGQKNKKELLSVIKKEIYEINSGFKKKVQYDELVPCICYECKESTDPHFYKWETLERHIQKGRQKINCEKSFLDVDVQELMGELVDKQNFELENIKRVNTNTSPFIIGLVWWGILAITILLFALSEFENFYLIVFLVAFMITFPVIIAFTLVDRKSLSERNLLAIIKMAFSKIPGLRWLGR